MVNYIPSSIHAFDVQPPPNLVVCQAQQDGATGSKSSGMDVVETSGSTIYILVCSVASSYGWYFRLYALLTVRNAIWSKEAGGPAFLSMSTLYFAYGNAGHPYVSHLSRGTHCVIACARPTLAADDMKYCLQPLRRLLLNKIGSSLSAAEMEDIDSSNFAGLRDKLLAEGPLDVAWIKKASE